jgi:hypothetical protein
MSRMTSLDHLRYACVASCNSYRLLRGADLTATIHNEIAWIIGNPAIVNGLRTAKYTVRSVSSSAVRANFTQSAVKRQNSFDVLVASSPNLNIKVQSTASIS